MLRFKLFLLPLLLVIINTCLYAGPREEYYDRGVARADKTSTIYYPTQTELTNTYFLNGIPFSVSNRDSSYSIVSMETDKIAGYKYFRLWVLYQNKTTVPYLFEPLKAFKLICQVKDKEYTLVPTAPSEILSRINSEKLGKQILQVIGAALQTVSAELSPEATVTDPSGSVYKINDKNASGKIGERTAEKMQGTSYMYQAYKNSINNIVLRRNTVFQDKNIMGYIYFSIPDIKPEKLNKIDLYMTTQDGIQKLEFIPQQGE